MTEEKNQSILAFFHGLCFFLNSSKIFDKFSHPKYTLPASEEHITEEITYIKIK